MLSLRVLKTFLAVVDTGSVVGAARERGYSAAAVSRQMSGLQRRLGVQLFLPDGRGIRPSAHAMRLAARTRVLIAEADAVEGYLKGISLEAAGADVASGCPPEASVRPPAVRELIASAGGSSR